MKKMGTGGHTHDELAKSIFLDALEIASERDRLAYLDRRCGPDHDLRAEVEALLHHQGQLGDYLEGPALDLDPTRDLTPRPITEGPGTVIGPYKLMEQIGEGGMGVVYVAEQTVPVRRRVALKVIKPGMDSRQVIARFEAERQALAMMDHPNIARVFDGGTTPDYLPPGGGGLGRGGGRPFFVMELVRGIPITEYCDEQKLTIRERLDLFVLVCRAVQHAHQKGIIHRDLKPSNILITLHDGVPVPKVIDFGVAKATGQSLTDKTVYTAFTQLIGTPLYMSPEQVELSGLDIDTRSDIYSLGVLLYELLTGTTPFDADTLRNAAFDEMRRIIREQEPQSPSMRLSSLGETLPTVSARRSVDARRLGPSLRGELDWVVMKALEKDRRRRYETANDFASDVMRYLTDQPVEACPPSTWYRFRKFASRNRVALVTSALVGTALVLGTTVSAWMAVRATRAERAAREDRDTANNAREAEGRARDRAEEAEKTALAEADKAKAINDFLVNDLLRQADPSMNAVSDRVTLREVLDRSADRLGERFRKQPLLEAALHTTMGEIYDSHEVRDKRHQHFAAALTIYEREKGPRALETARAKIALGGALEAENQFAQAEPLLRQGLDSLRHDLGQEHPDTLNAMLGLAMLCAHSDKPAYAEAEGLLVKALELSRRVLGEEHPTTLSALNLLACHYIGSDPAKALPMLAKVLEVSCRALGAEDPLTLTNMNNLACYYRDHGKLAEAEPLLIKAVAGSRHVLGGEHPDTLRVMHNLGELYRIQGKLAEAEPLLLAEFEGMRARDQSVPTRVEGNLVPALKQIVRLYEAWGQPEKAAVWRGKLPPAAGVLPADVFARP
jgi:serine/threonine protein kinase/tetratricopeptide (TPR) repeat protein